MSNVKRFLSLANSMVIGTNKARQDIKDEGKTKEWESKQFSELLKKSQEHSNKIAQDMIEVARGEYQDARDKAKEMRVRRYTDSSAKLYHQNNARMALDGLEPGEAVKLYPQLIDNLTEQERKEHLHVYEDVLLNRMKGDHERELAQQEIMKHKTLEEKNVIGEAMNAEKQLETVKTIAEHFKYDIERIASGEIDNPGYDYTTLLDEPPRHVIEGIEAFEEAIKPTDHDDGTPYDGGSNDHPDLQ